MNKEVLEKLYLEDKLSTREIAKKLGTPHWSKVWRWLKKLNIPTRTITESKMGHYTTSTARENMSITQRKRGGKNIKRNSRNEARRVWEDYWHEKVPEGYLIHHVDRDYTNNDICNLALLTYGFHNRIHRYNSAGKHCAVSEICPQYASEKKVGA